MSRSTKKPYYTGGQKNRPYKQRSPKQEANKAVRAAEDIPSDGAYKKVYNTYNICDYSSYVPKDKKAYRK